MEIATLVPTVPDGQKVRLFLSYEKKRDYSTPIVAALFSHHFLLRSRKTVPRSDLPVILISSQTLDAIGGNNLRQPSVIALTFMFEIISVEMEDYAQIFQGRSPLRIIFQLFTTVVFTLHHDKFWMFAGNYLLNGGPQKQM